jgi:hypothetical protein
MNVGTGNEVMQFHFWEHKKPDFWYNALLSVETDVNGDSKSTNERGSAMGGLLGMSCWYKNFCSALAALIGPAQNIFPHRKTHVPVALKLGRQPCWVACHLLCWSGPACTVYMKMPTFASPTSSFNQLIRTQSPLMSALTDDISSFFYHPFVAKQQYIQLINLDCTNHHKSRMSVYRFTQAKNIQSFGLFQIFFPFFELRIIEHRLIMIAGMLPE